jgi:hypothetical protein
MVPPAVRSIGGRNKPFTSACWSACWGLGGALRILADALCASTREWRPPALSWKSRSLLLLDHMELVELDRRTRARGGTYGQPRQPATWSTA